MVRYKVMIGVTTGEYGRRADFYDYLNLLVKPPDSFVILGHDRSPAKGRNLIIDAAIEHNCTHVLIIDDDTTFEPNALLKLLKHDVDIVSGLYLVRSYPHQPLVFDVADDDGSCLPMYLMKDTKGLVPIVAAGFGFLLIKTVVFKKLEKPYVRLGELDSEQWCDDIGFFKRVREAGIQSYCDLNTCIGHIGTMIVRPEFKNGEWHTVYDTGGSGAISTPQIVVNAKYAFQDK